MDEFIFLKKDIRKTLWLTLLILAIFVAFYVLEQTNGILTRMSKF